MLAFPGRAGAVRGGAGMDSRYGTAAAYLALMAGAGTEMGCGRAYEEFG